MYMTNPFNELGQTVAQYQSNKRNKIKFGRYDFRVGKSDCLASKYIG